MCTNTFLSQTITQINLPSIVGKAVKDQSLRGHAILSGKRYRSVKTHASIFRAGFFPVVIGQMNRPTYNYRAVLNYYLSYWRPLDYVWLDFAGLYLALNIIHVIPLIMYLYTVTGSIVIMYCISADWLTQNRSFSLYLGSRDNKLNWNWKYYSQQFLETS